MKTEQVIIIGSGPAGHSAAIYAARAELHPVLFEGFMAGDIAAGGQLTVTSDVENYPGFPEGILGPTLMEAMRRQSIHCGARVLTETVVSVDLSVRPFVVVSESGERFRARVLIVATGATALRLGLPGEEDYWQKGISACAICDGALPIFRDQPLAVIGGGDSACEEASYLTKFGSRVFLLVRRGVFRASKVIQQRVIANPKIEILWHTVATRIIGDGRLMNAIETKNRQTGATARIEARGLFYAVGHTPNTLFLSNQLATDEVGYITTDPGSSRTSVEGVFAAGDVQDRVYRQAVTAAGSGCMAALDAERWLSASNQSNE